MGFSLPPMQQVVDLALHSMSKGLPKEECSSSSKLEGAGRSCLSDLHVPSSWTNGDLKWHNLLAAAHVYREHINIYESRFLCRVAQVAAKIPHLRRSRILALEDNSVTHYNFIRGRSPK